MSPPKEFESLEDALEHLNGRGIKEVANGVFRGDWNSLDQDSQSAINYLFYEWDFAYEHVDSPESTPNEKGMSS